jgi:predicted DNA-binding protein
MSTRNPRVNTSLSDEAYAALERLAAATGVGLSTMLRIVVEGQVTEMNRRAAHLEKFQPKPGK